MSEYVATVESIGDYEAEIEELTDYTATVESTNDYEAEIEELT
jgi:hypothetical protein